MANSHLVRGGSKSEAKHISEVQNAEGRAAFVLWGEECRFGSASSSVNRGRCDLE